MSLEKLVRPIVDIKKGEWSKVLLTFLYFYLTITAYYILKPARNSLYINFLGANNIPYVIMFIAVTSLFIITVYTQFAKKIENNKVVSGFLFLSIFCLLFFRWGFNLTSPGWMPGFISFVFYVWLTLFSAISVMQFWVLVNDVFDVQAAKRLYGFVGTGGILGGISGGIIAMQAKKLGTENLLLVSALYVLLMIVLYNVIWYREKKNFLVVTHEDETDIKHSARDSFKVLSHSKYLVLVLLIIALIKLVTVQTEWQYNKFAEIEVVGMNNMTVFFGKISAYLSLIALVIQFVFTSRVLKKFNFHGALLPLPMGLFLGSIAIVFYPALLAASILKITEGSTRYSINQTATNYLYLPITRTVRYKVKPFMDVCAYQVAKGVGGFITFVYLYFMVNVFACNDLVQAKVISYVNVALLLVWFCVIYMVKNEYANEIRRFLKGARNKDIRERKLSRIFLRKYFDKSKDDIFLEYKNILNESHFKSANIRIAVCVALYEAGLDKEGVRALIEEIVKEENLSSDIPELNNQTDVDSLLSSLSEEKDTGQRYNAIRALNELKKKNNEFDFDAETIEFEVLQELQDYYHTFAVFLLYESLSKKGENPDLLSSAIRNNLDQNMERIFRLLALLYNPVDIHMIYRGLMNDNVYIRANALELFDCTVHAKLKKKMLPVLDGELSLFGPDRAGLFTSKMKDNSIFVLRRAIKNEDMWISLGAMFLVAKLRISDLYDDVKTELKSNNKLRHDAAFFINKCIEKSEQGGDCA